LASTQGATLFIVRCRVKRESKIKNHEWISAAHYLLRDGKKELTEKEIVAELNEAEKKGKKLFAECGGSGKPPVTDDDRFDGPFKSAAEHQKTKR